MSCLHNWSYIKYLGSTFLSAESHTLPMIFKKIDTEGDIVLSIRNTSGLFDIFENEVYIFLPIT